jgi:ribosomal protein S25
LVKKQKKKSSKRQVRTSQNWESRILVHILSAKYPVTASQLQAEIGIKQPIAFKILKSLHELGCIKVFDVEEKYGPKRVYYAPTIDCLYYTCFMEYSRKTGKTTDEKIGKTPTFQKFDIIYDRWIKHPVFLESVSELVGPEHGIAHKEVRDALKEHCKFSIKCQEAYEEVKNDLGMFWKNMIGSSVVRQREPTYHENTVKRLYKYLLPFKTEIDYFTSKTKELADEYRNEK